MIHPGTSASHCFLVSVWGSGCGWGTTLPFPQPPPAHPGDQYGVEERDARRLPGQGDDDQDLPNLHVFALSLPGGFVIIPEVSPTHLQRKQRYDVV